MRTSRSPRPTRRSASRPRSSRCMGRPYPSRKSHRRTDEVCLSRTRTRTRARPPGASAALGSNICRKSHATRSGHSVAMFRDRFWITLLLTMPTLEGVRRCSSGWASSRRYSPEPGTFPPLSSSPSTHSCCGGPGCRRRPPLARRPPGDNTKLFATRVKSHTVGCMRAV